jgi:hypothetical protein
VKGGKAWRKGNGRNPRNPRAHGKEEGGRKEGKTMPVFGYELVMFYTILLIMSIDSIQ